MENTASNENRSISLPGAWIDRLFVRLDAAYGNKFREMWKGQDVAEVKQFWAKELSNLTVDDIRAGLALLRKEHPSWPPSLYEFAELCKATIKPEPHKALPWPKIDRAMVNPQIAELTKILAGDRPNPRAWADKILKRQADGDKTVQWYAEKLARECVAMTQRGE